MSCCNGVDTVCVSSLCRRSWHTGWLPGLWSVSAGSEAQLHVKPAAERLCSPADSWRVLQGLSTARSRLQLQPWEHPTLCMQPCSESGSRSSTPAGTATETAAGAGAVCPQHQTLTTLQVRDQIMRERAEGRGEATPQPIPRPGQQVDIKVSRL